MTSTQVHGNLSAYFETGMEGIHWSLIDPTKKGYDGLHILKDGHHLTIHSKDKKTTLWQGDIKLEYERNMSTGRRKQQCVLNHWIHGLQEDVDPETRASYFFDKLPATLTIVTNES